MPSKTLWYAFYISAFIGLLVVLLFSSRTGHSAGLIGVARNVTAFLGTGAKAQWYWEPLLVLAAVLSTATVLYVGAKTLANSGDFGIYVIILGFSGSIALLATSILDVQALGIALLAIGAVICYWREKEPPQLTKTEAVHQET